MAEHIVRLEFEQSYAKSDATNDETSAGEGDAHEQVCWHHFLF